MNQTGFTWWMGCEKQGCRNRVYTPASPLSIERNSKNAHRERAPQLAFTTCVTNQTTQPSGDGFNLQPRPIRYSPLNFGLRFSAKATAPSRKSSDASMVSYTGNWPLPGCSARTALRVMS